ncbi:MAG: type IX secretion system outer membrane channel protein PorV [Paludibacteraceae bacterium]|nr:type IX secretion system outer membrane channel protein PorV [Paludibacteraceae bacterium]MBP6284302.1 type IX secretion system outer membrane channel protein PorV [Paludibacteraceae bacterium]
MKKLLILFVNLFLFSSLSSYVFAQAEIDGDKTVFNPITTGVPFLSIAPDARGGAMGDAGVASSPDAYSQYWNPAKFAFVDGAGGMSLSYTPWLRKLVKDIDLAYLSGYYKIADVQTVSASLRYFSLGEVMIRKDATSPAITAKPYDLAIDATYSRILAENFSMGVTLRFIYSDLLGGAPVEEAETLTPGAAVAADISAYYGAPVAFAEGEGFARGGLNISNIGSKISYGDDLNMAFLPTNMRLGGSVTYPLDPYNKISANLDLNKLLVPSRPVKIDTETDTEYETRLLDYNNSDPIAGIFTSFGDAPGGFSEELQEIMWSLGLEYAYNNQFFVRGGYFNESANKGNRKYATLGAGFKLNVFSLDVAYVISVAQNNPLDQTLRFSLAFTLDGIKQFANR